MKSAKSIYIVEVSYISQGINEKYQNKFDSYKDAYKFLQLCKQAKYSSLYFYHITEYFYNDNGIR